ATVHERSGGRLLLGLGTGPSTAGALDRLRATVGALRTAFGGGEGSVEGAPVRSPLRLPSPPEIWTAALGPRATPLVGDVADGVTLTDGASAADRLAAYRAAGADLPVVYPVLAPGDPSADAARATIEAVAPG